MTRLPPSIARLRQSVCRERLLDTALKLVAVPSRTGEAGSACDTLAEILHSDGFQVERRAAGHPAAPAVVVRHETGRPGRTLQFNGHLDTVHLPFVPPRVEGNLLRGSGAADMKGGTAAAVEALRALRDSEALPAGSILLTAHDLHEAPWGYGQQLDALIREGVVGDAVLIPEPLYDRLPLIGRGAATWEVRLNRPGPPVHEVMRPDEPSVIAAGAELVLRLRALGEDLAKRRDPLAGCETVFVGQIHSGEIYNQYPQTCLVEGTRRWLPGVERAAVEQEFRQLLAQLEQATGTTIQCDFRFIRDAFSLDAHHPLVNAFQQARSAITGTPLPTGPKPFVDDGNSFYGVGRTPAITYGPRAGGQHTLEEWADVDDLVQVAQTYATTAVLYLGNST